MSKYPEDDYKPLEKHKTTVSDPYREDFLLARVEIERLEQVINDLKVKIAVLEGKRWNDSTITKKQK